MVVETQGQDQEIPAGDPLPGEPRESSGIPSPITVSLVQASNLQLRKTPAGAGAAGPSRRGHPYLPSGRGLPRPRWPIHQHPPGCRRSSRGGGHRHHPPAHICGVSYTTVTVSNVVTETIHPTGQAAHLVPAGFAAEHGILPNEITSSVSATATDGNHGFVNAPFWWAWRLVKANRPGVGLCPDVPEPLESQGRQRISCILLTISSHSDHFRNLIAH